MIYHISLQRPKLNYDIKVVIKRVQIDEEGSIEKFVKWEAIKNGVTFASGVDDCPIDIGYISEMAEFSLLGK